MLLGCISLPLFSHHLLERCSSMTADEYLQRILGRQAVDTGSYSPVRIVQSLIEPAIREWADNFLLSVDPSGSFAKGTANHSGTDIRPIYLTGSADAKYAEGDLQYPL